MKLAFVVQRYGEEVDGGAELLCRRLATRLSNTHEIEVLTTCAIDYMTWTNEYPEGMADIDGVCVRRFRVDRPRDIKDFNEFSLKVFGAGHTIEQEIEWMKKQGPYSTELFEFLKRNRANYDLFVFFTYLYCTTFFGLDIASERGVLVPTAHDEPPIRLNIFKKVFHIPRGIVYLTPEEQGFIVSRFHNGHIPSVVAGLGFDPPSAVDESRFLHKVKLRDPYVLYVGRIDESKGCKVLFEYFTKYKLDHPSRLKLVLLGKPVMRVPDSPHIVWAGFGTEEDKFDAMKGSSAVIMPSQYESFSIATLESWLMGKPALVNGASEVLKGHCLRSNGGLFYGDYEEFEAALEMILNDKDLARRLGESGKKYVLRNYSWPAVEGKYNHFLQQVVSSSQANAGQQEKTEHRRATIG
jgi:glycosyltransferase involved in cell wall biosynthesis